MPSPSSFTKLKNNAGNVALDDEVRFDHSKNGPNGVYGPNHPPEQIPLTPRTALDVTLAS